ncbi:nitroreductase family protein [Saliterribacillus persicus]|uniref:Putative NAD(P)H nitroreductase n=1 Tax=Saliterribacillus persicus TaxID=930114 RepID=A0A368XB88_9BACI|nr:nitroreductase [Saliterribacillus persicus]RCW64268.1 nitroreductase [Saliterribacillus persicus]
MELKRIIEERRSVQLFQDKEVPEKLMKELLETAIWVPNHKMTQPWRFVFVKGEAKKRLASINQKLTEEKCEDGEREKLGQLAFEKINNLPFIIMVLNELNEKEKLQEEDYASTSCVIHNLSLLAWEQGIGMIWKTGKLSFCDETTALIGMKDNERVVGMLQIGYPAKVPKALPRKDVNDRITILED